MNENWRQHAKCERDGVDPNFFYPIAPSGKSSEGTLEERQAEVAKYCHGMGEYRHPCPVRLECLDYAISNKIDDGVFGGTTEKERVRIRVNRKKSA